MLDEMILAFNKSKSTPNELSGSETELFDSLTIQLPEKFNQLSEESIKERYAFEPRPAIVYAQNNGNVNFGFCYLEKRDIALPIYLSKVMDSIKAVFPNTLIYGEDTIVPDHEGCAICYFDFRSSSLEGPIYNIIYLASNGRNTLMGSFNCPFEEYMDWKDTALSVIRTIVFQ